MTRQCIGYAAIFGAIVVAACSGKSAVNQTQLIRELKLAISSPIEDDPTRTKYSELTKQVAEEGVLEGKRRYEVEAMLGKGKPCTLSTVCASQRFEADDWVYDVGTVPAGSYGRVPQLFVGFDRFGVCDKVFYLVPE